MEETKVRKSEKVKVESKLKDKKKVEVRRWQKPVLKDVSGKVMAQPYIRFT